MATGWWAIAASLVVTVATASLLPRLAAAANAPDISGTWVAHQNGPFGEMELIGRFKTDAAGHIGGFLTAFNDSPIRDGRVVGDHVELTVEMDSFGDVEQRQITAQLVGDELRFDSAAFMPRMPAAPPGAPPGAAPEPGPPLEMPAPGAKTVFHRGEPRPSYRAEPIDFKTLAPVPLPAPATVRPNKLARTPPMGWNSWNKFQVRIDDKTVREMADALVASGMRDAGYVYINLDDGWQGRRDSNGVLQPNPNFPDMKALADYVHGKGLKLGIYSTPGPRSCQNYEGSYGHEQIDAQTWAKWGIDYVKYDWCSGSRIWRDADMRAVYQRMGAALAAAGRPMVFSLCQYGRADVRDWGTLVGGNLWRTTGDIADRWPAMLRNVESQDALANAAGVGHWNDPDMLEIGNGGMSADEYRAHLSLWAIAAAPLIAGNDIRTMDATTRAILTNKEVIAVDQDRLGRPGHRVAQRGGIDVWLRSLGGGAWALVLVNRGEADAEVNATWAELNLPAKVHVRDLWQHADLGMQPTGYRGHVAAHGVAMLRLSR